MRRSALRRAAPAGERLLSSEIEGSRPYLRLIQRLFERRSPGKAKLRQVLLTLPSPAVKTIAKLIGAVVLLKAPLLTETASGVSLLKKIRSSRKYKAMRMAVKSGRRFKTLLREGTLEEWLDFVTTFSPVIGPILAWYSATTFNTREKNEPEKEQRN